MPTVTCSEVCSWLRAECGVPVGRYMRSPGSSSTSRSSPPSTISHCLRPWVWNTKTSWVSLCRANPCDPGGVR